MKALTLNRYGKLPDIDLADVPRPTLGAHDLLVEVHAVGLNPIDNMIPTGMFKPVVKLQLPAVMGSDLAGVVRDVGNAVTRFKPGDEVFASVFDLCTGSLAAFVAVPEHVAAPKPARLTFTQAASVPMVGLTAWQALKERAALRPGDKVFIPAGAGGIGSMAIQLAKHFGARVTSTTSTGNVPLVRSLGADDVVDYTRQKFEQQLSGYDIALGTLRGDEIEKALGILKPGGQLVSLTGPLDPAFARSRGLNALLQGVFWLMSFKVRRLAARRKALYSFLFVRPDGGQLREIGRLLQSQQLQPVIDRVYPFEQAKEALAYLAQGRAKGKVVVQLK